jgi:hypothetical protein
LVKGTLRLRAAAGMTAAVIATYAWLRETEEGVTQAMLKVFEDGGVSGWDAQHEEVDGLATVPRPEVLHGLQSLLRPDISKQYAVVVGENGTGKSTAVRQAIRSLPDPKGVIYFLTSDSVTSFSTELAQAVGYREAFSLMARFRRWLKGRTEEERAHSLKHEPFATWSSLRPKLKHVAVEYKKKHGHPAVLVIDAADIVCKHEREFFLQLQEFAKAGADSGSLRVVFVFSEGEALPVLQSKSAWSRALQPPYEVTDIPDDLAVQFLEDGGVGHTRASDAVRTITGGRFALLLGFAGAATSKSNEEILHELDVSTGEALLKAGIGATHRLFKQLSLSKYVDRDVAKRWVGHHKIDQLLSDNVLAARANGTYTFHARHVETFFADAPSKWPPVLLTTHTWQLCAFPL